jgi:beta-N-acetylhexosaminidase
VHRRRASSLLVVAAGIVLTACGAGQHADHEPASAPPSIGATSDSISHSVAPPSATVATTPPGPAANPAGLTDTQLVGQLFIGYAYGGSATTASPAQRQANLALYGAATGAGVVRRWHLGGIILFDTNNLDPARPGLSTDNVDNGPQITALTAGLQQAALADSGVQLLIGTDQEGGQVQRITKGVSRRPAEAQVAGLGATALRCSYRGLGWQLRSLGVNQDYAPVGDVVRASGGVIGDRSFGPDPTTDARDVLAAVNGLQDAGVLATVKHWPGHGSTPVDSHEDLPVLSESEAQWAAVDRPPFQAVAGVAGSVMVGHLALPALDASGQPATLSPILITQQLRQKLGYRGLVLTDSMWMAPMQQAGTAAQVAIRAIQAGADMLLESPNVPSAYTAILAKVRAEPGFRAAVQARVTDILTAKAKVIATPTTTAC